MTIITYWYLYTYNTVAGNFAVGNLDVTDMRHRNEQNSRRNKIEAIKFKYAITLY